MSDERLMDLYRKVGLFGLNDLNRIAPIGDIGYLNGIDFYGRYYGGTFKGFLRSTLVDWVYKAYCDQYKKWGWTETASKSGRCIHDYHCPELGFSYGIDSSD